MPEQIFLAPRSGYTASQNFEHTIDTGVMYIDIESYLPDEGKRILQNREKLYAWGNLPGKRGSWNKMNEGDYVLFYQQGNYTCVGNLIYKLESEDLANHLWGLDPQGRPWQYIFFLKNLRKINLPATRIQQLADYGRSVVYGFQSLNEQGVNNIISNYGNIESFIQNYLETSEDSTQESDPAMDGNTYATKLALLTRKKQIILYGPPGTGKTYEARILAKIFLDTSFGDEFVSNND